jgi:predicted Co/Zn/Cd cation transporter (cation efflux family)
MILLHGGLSIEMIGGVFSGFFGALVVFIWLHSYARRSEFYKERFVHFDVGQKIMAYMLFLAAAVFISFVALWVFGLSGAWIVSLVA